MRHRETGDLIVLLVVFTLCLTFIFYIGTALVRWHDTPRKPYQPDPLTAAVQACEKQGGIPVTKWTKMDGYGPEEGFDHCEYKAAQPTQ